MIELDRFEILEKIGEGSMGEVYKAHQISMDRVVAIKVLDPELAQDEVFAGRFMQEARAIGKLNHPNVVQGIDFGQSGEHLFFVMEYVDGPSLYEILKKEPLDEDEVLEIALQVARALEHGHNQGIVHRDIKPGNIMISVDGAAKVTDYGLAKRDEGGSGKSTAAGRVMGTPYYISPEQAQGAEDIDIRSDIYSLGATMYHAATGKPPFQGNNAADIMSKALKEPFPDPRQVKPELSAAFSKLVLKLTAKEKKKRPADPVVLVKEIERVMRASAAERHQQNVGANLRRILRRVTVKAAEGRQSLSPKVKLGITGAVAAIAVIVILMLMSGKSEDTTQPEKPGKPPAVAHRPAAKPQREKKPEQTKEEYVEEELRKAEEELAAKAKEAYLAAEAFARGTDDLSAAMARLERVAEDFGGEFAEKAKALASELQKKWEDEGTAELEKCKAEAAGALAELNYGRAARAYDKFPVRLNRTAAGKRAVELREKILRQGLSHYGRLKAEANKLAGGGKFDEALELYEKAQGFGLENVSADAKAKIAALEKKRSETEARRASESKRKSDRLYAAFYGEFKAHVDKGEFSAALALCERVLADSAKKDIHDAVRLCLGDAAMVLQVKEAAAKAAPKLKLQERTFRLKGGRVVKGLVRGVKDGVIDVELADMKGAILGVEVSNLCGEDFVKLALVVLDDKPASHLACGVYLLFAEKDGPTAEKEFALAAAGGLDVSRYAKAVAALKKEQFEQEATKLYGELKDNIRRKKWDKVAEVAEKLTEKYKDSEVVKSSLKEISKAHTDAVLCLAREDKGKTTKKGTKLASGLIGTYYNGRNFDNQRLQRIDQTIDFRWGNGSPHPDVNNNNFSIRWEGFVVIPKSGRYTFIFNSDDGCRMWLNGQELFNDWRGRAPADSSKEVTLEKGCYSIKIEYFEAGSGASARLFWSVGGGARQIIPAKYLGHLPK